MNAFLARYATGTGFFVRIPMIKAGVSDFAASGDWTPATGDVKISKDGGAQANIATLPTYTNGRWHFTFSDAELTAKRIDVTVIDSATKAVEDQAFNLETYGHASACYVMDFGDPLTAADIWSYSAGRTLSEGASQVVAGQQMERRTIVRGNSYSLTARDLSYLKQAGADWPEDLDEWTWTWHADKGAGNINSGSLEVSSSVSVTTATGESQEVRVSGLTAALTSAMAPGVYQVSVRGSKGSNPVEYWDIVLGPHFVEDSPHQTVITPEEEE